MIDISIDLPRYHSNKVLLARKENSLEALLLEQAPNRTWIATNCCVAVRFDQLIASGTININEQQIHQLQERGRVVVDISDPTALFMYPTVHRFNALTHFDKRHGMELFYERLDENGYWIGIAIEYEDTQKRLAGYLTDRHHTSFGHYGEFNDERTILRYISDDNDLDFDKFLKGFNKAIGEYQVALVKREDIF